jgi:GTP-binding protein HflX
MGNIEAVNTVLGEIGAGEVPDLLAFNKSDLAPLEAKRLVERSPGSVAFSAATGDDVDLLVRTIGDRVRALTRVVELVIPYERGDLLAAVHRGGEVLSERPGEGGMYIRGRFDEATVGRLQEFVTNA